MSRLLREDQEYAAPATASSHQNGEESSDSETESLPDLEITRLELQSHLDHISDLVTKLLHLARVIRTSGVRSRVVKAANYVYYDENGIDQTKEFEETYLPRVLRHRFHLTEPILSRLCKVIASRRRQFLYQQRHQKRLAYSGTLPAYAEDLGVTPLILGMAAPLDPKPVPPPSKAARSAIIAPTIATTFRMNERKRPACSTIVASTTKLAMTSIDFPEPPSIPDKANHFECPYCCLLVEERKVAPTAWRKHVIHDLQPFVCIESTCPDPYIVLETWNDWVEHHRWTHAMEWWCEGMEADHPPSRYTTSEEYSDHLISQHMSELSMSAVVRLVNASGGPSPEPFKGCPFCDFQPRLAGPSELARVGQNKIQGHIFDHLISMFLLALPERNDIGDSTVDDDESSAPLSGVAAAGWSRSSARSTSEQDPAGFAEFVRSFSLDTGKDQEKLEKQLDSDGNGKPTQNPHDLKKRLFQCPKFAANPESCTGSKCDGWSSSNIASVTRHVKKDVKHDPEKLRRIQDLAHMKFLPDQRWNVYFDIFSEEGLEPRPQNPHAIRRDRHIPCTFHHYGCTSIFANKNEWKRHIGSQHVQLRCYRCDIGSCADTSKRYNDFSHADLFTQHCRRMHAPRSGTETGDDHISKTERDNFEKSLDDIRRRCRVQRRNAPTESKCGFCMKLFRDAEEPGSWGRRLEHISLHFDQDEVTAESETVDPHLKEWAIKEGVIVEGTKNGEYWLPEREPGGGTVSSFSDSSDGPGRRGHRNLDKSRKGSASFTSSVDDVSRPRLPKGFGTWFPPLMPRSHLETEDSEEDLIPKPPALDTFAIDRNDAPPESILPALQTKSPLRATSDDSLDQGKTLTSFKTLLSSFEASSFPKPAGSSDESLSTGKLGPFATEDILGVDAVPFAGANAEATTSQPEARPMRCDQCKKPISLNEIYYHCSICDDGDRLWCGACHQGGWSNCGHELSKKIWTRWESHLRTEFSQSMGMKAPNPEEAAKHPRFKRQQSSANTVGSPASPQAQTAYTSRRTPLGHRFYCPFPECPSGYAERGFVWRVNYENHMGTQHYGWPAHDPLRSIREIPTSTHTAPPPTPFSHRRTPGTIAWTNSPAFPGQSVLDAEQDMQQMPIGERNFPRSQTNFNGRKR